MLINRVELPLSGHRPLLDTIKACAPHLETWRKLFPRRCTHRPEMSDVLEKVENMNEAACSNSAVSDPGTAVITKSFPNLRCSV
jgi:hypothetical protein